MRALAAHSSNGEILTLVIAPPDGPPVAGISGADQLISEIEIPDEIVNLIRERGDELQILETLKAHRVDLSGEARLVRTEPTHEESTGTA
jgi:hypothetical protein